jgi:hypothetical protein
VLDLVHELQIRRYPRPAVEMEIDHRKHPFTNQLVKGCYMTGLAVKSPA